MSNGWKWRSGARWRSRCFPLITSWQCPIWCGRAAATTDSLPTGEQTLAERLTRKNGMGWELGNEWDTYYPRRNNKVKTCVETENHAAQTAWSWDLKISHGSTSRDQISEAWVQRNYMEAKGRNIDRLLRLIDWFDIFLPAWTFLTDFSVWVKLTKVSGGFVPDEREAKVDLKPMTCYSWCYLRGAPKTQFQNDAVEPRRLRTRVITLD